MLGFYAKDVVVIHDPWDPIPIQRLPRSPHALLCERSAQRSEEGMGFEGFTPVLGGKLLALLVGFRILNALTVRTSFTPDEFWQGPEVAHSLAFGRGHL